MVFFEALATLRDVPVVVRILRLVVSLLLPHGIFTGGFCSGARDILWLQNYNKLNVGIQVFIYMKTFDVSCETARLFCTGTSYGQHLHRESLRFGSSRAVH